MPTRTRRISLDQSAGNITKIGLSASVFTCGKAVEAGQYSRQDKNYQQDGACGSDGYSLADLFNGRLTEALSKDSGYGHNNKT